MNLRTAKRQAAVALVALLVIFLGFNVSRVGAVGGCRKACASTAERTDGPLRVMVLNVLHGFPRFERLLPRLDHIAGEIRRLDPDLVLLQEVPWTLRSGDGARYLGERTGLNHVSARDNGNRWLLQFDSSLAILSRYPLRDASVTKLEPRASFFENRVALRATTVTPWGPVRVFVTHLTNGDREVNRKQTESLASWVARAGTGLTLVGGDFNAVPESPQIRSLSERWLDTYRTANPTEAGPTCCAEDLTAASSDLLEERIDYLFIVPDPRIPARVKSSLRVLAEPFRWQGGWQWASDHAGLLAEIEWRENAPLTATLPGRTIPAAEGEVTATRG